MGRPCAITRRLLRGFVRVVVWAERQVEVHTDDVLNFLDNQASVARLELFGGLTAPETIAEGVRGFALSVMPTE